MSQVPEQTGTLEVPLKHVAEYEKLGVLPMSKRFNEPDPTVSFLTKPHTLFLLFCALGLLCYLGFTRDDTNSVSNTKVYVYCVAAHFSGCHFSFNRTSPTKCDDSSGLTNLLIDMLSSLDLGPFLTTCRLFLLRFR